MKTPLSTWIWVAGATVGTVAFQAGLYSYCGIGFPKLLGALLFASVPTLVIVGISGATKYPISAVSGLVALAPFSYWGFRADCVDIDGSGGAAFGALLPLIWGTPIALFVSWLHRGALKDWDENTGAR